MRRRREPRDDEWGIDGTERGREKEEREHLPAPLEPGALVPKVDPTLVEFARDAMRSARAKATNRGYEIDWEAFKTWCRRAETPFLPATPEAVVLYFSWLARDGEPRRGRRRGKRGYSMATIDRARASIAYFHHQGNYLSPTKHPRVKDLVRGLRRQAAEAPARARPLMPMHLAAIDRALRASRRSGLKYLRDRAILLVGFAGALRKSEIVALRRKDVHPQDGGLHLDLVQQQGLRVSEIVPGTKYHAAGEGQHVAFEADPALVELGICPIKAARDWHDALPAEEDGIGPFVRRVRRGEVEEAAISSRKVERLVKEGAELVGLDPRFYGGHSLRAGMATYLIYEREKNLFTVRDYLRHSNVETLNVYVRKWDDLPRRNA